MRGILPRAVERRELAEEYDLEILIDVASGVLSFQLPISSRQSSYAPAEGS